MQAAVSSDLTKGSVFAGRYRVERLIAAGGMGAVYEVVHIETNRRRALKVMHANFVSSDDLRGRFRQEARVAAEIESEHIVDVFDAGIDETTRMPFLVMELLRGEEIGKLVKRAGALPKEDVVRYLYETSLALDKTHKARIVHRDLKPDNLFLCEREHGPPRVKVLDFGIAKIVKDAETQANATSSLGTPLYMAPEQFSIKSTVSSATDIFALGMIAFTLLVGKPYWYTESKMPGGLMAFAMHALAGPQDPPVARAWQQFGIPLPPAFDAWFFRATAREPEARFATAGDAVKALADVLGVSLPAHGVTAASRASLPSLSAAEPAVFTPVESTILLPSANSSAPTAEARTGPTLMAMTPTPVESTSASVERGMGTRLLVVIASAAVVVVGLGVMLVVKGFSQGDADKPSDEATRAEGAVHAPAAASIAVVTEPVVSVAEPEASAAAAPTSSAQAPVVTASKPSPSGKATTKRVVRPSTGGTWEAD